MRLSREEEDALWQQVFTAQPARRREFEPSSKRRKRATRALAARYGLNPKTVAKWRRRTTTADAPMGPSRPRSTVLTEAEEAIVVEFRRRTLLPLDDVLGCLRETHPQAHPQRPAPLPAAPRHLPAAPGRRERLQAGALRRDQDRLRAHRRLRAAPRPRASSSCSWPSTGCPSSPTSPSSTPTPS